MSIRPVKLGSLALGVNNRREPVRLAVGGDNPGRFIQFGENIDITADGYLKRRKGVELELDGRVHSLWADLLGACAVVNDELCQLTDTGAGLAAAVVRSGLPNAVVSYSRGADQAVYWTNGAEIRRIEAGADLPAATASPSLVPAVSLIAGALPAGKYLVAVTIEHASNGESAASEVVQIDVPANGGLRIQSAEPLTVYASGPDGDILTFQGRLVAGQLDFVVHQDGGRRCATLNTAPMPPGSIVRHYNGAMLVASGRVLYVSLPFNYGLYSPARGYIPFPGDITLVEPVEGGVYIAADHTYFIADVLKGESGLSTVLPYGAVAGSSTRSRKTKLVFWQSPRGLISGDAQGAVKALQEDVLAFSEADGGASLYRERDGMHHVISTRTGSHISTATATTWMDAELIRKGTP